MNLKELEAHFSGLKLPLTLELGKSEFINNVPIFVEVSISYLKNNTKKKCFIPYYDRLMKVYWLTKHLKYE